MFFSENMFIGVADHYHIPFAFRTFDMNIAGANKRFKQTLLRAAAYSEAIASAYPITGRSYKLRT